MKTEKDCKGCQEIKPIESFVTVYGYSNSRGKYCKECFQEHQQEHAKSLMDGRDYCLYCGSKIAQAYDWYPDGKSKKCYLHQDHMDPLALGGEDNEINTVYCCAVCNIKKKDTEFSFWLKKLKPKMRRIAKGIYISKHGRTPEEFIPSNNEIVISIDLSELINEL